MYGSEEICSICNETYEECIKKSDLLSIIDEINFYTNSSNQINNLKYRDMIQLLKSDNIFLKKIKKYLILYRRGDDKRFYLLKELDIKLINEYKIRENTCIYNYSLNNDHMIQNIKRVYGKIKGKTIDKIENDDYDNIMISLVNVIKYFEL